MALTNRYSYHVNLDGAEEAVFGFNVINTQGMQGAMILAQDWINAFWGTPLVAASYSTRTVIDQVKVTQVDTATGHVTETDTQQVSKAGTSPSAMLPNEVATCVSLRSTFPGPRGRGRFYLPAPAATQLEANGRMTLAFTTRIADAVKAAFDSISAVEPPRVYSRAGQALHPVVSISVGDVFDAQLRRRRSLAELRQVRLV